MFELSDYYTRISTRRGKDKRSHEVCSESFNSQTAPINPFAQESSHFFGQSVQLKYVPKRSGNHPKTAKTKLTGVPSHRSDPLTILTQSIKRSQPLNATTKPANRSNQPPNHPITQTHNRPN